MSATELPRATPSSRGVDAAGIEAFLDAMEAAPDVELHGLMLLRDGHVVAEGWWTPYRADRVHLLWAGAAPRGVALPREVRLVRADDGLRAGLAGADAAGDAAWLIDPNGFVVLRYAPGFDPGDLRTDLARLLKIN